jgi:arsenite/tail-anchored protein-transporting ATPase
MFPSMPLLLLIVFRVVVPFALLVSVADSFTGPFSSRSSFSSTSLSSFDAFSASRLFVSSRSSTTRRASSFSLFPPRISSSSASSRLYSLSKLVQDIRPESASSKSSTSSSTRPTIFVGGKGGVGKTTISSALAVDLASRLIGNGGDLDNILIVSTDPAHSLGDALDVDLNSSHGKPVQLTDPLTRGRLWACQVDAASALDDFTSKMASAFDIEKLASALGVSTDFLNGLGLDQFASLLSNPPPGLDELVALSNVLDNSDSNSESNVPDFDLVIVDTAPTGHTLRLLALPQFLDGFLGKLIALRLKLSGLASTLQSLVGDARAQEQTRAIDNALQKLQLFKSKMERFQTQLKNRDITRFVVVTIPTTLAVAESKRLIAELRHQKVAITDIVVNQYLGSDDDSNNNNAVDDTNAAAAAASAASVHQYYARRKAGQDKWLHKLQSAVDTVSASPEYQSNSGQQQQQQQGQRSRPIAVTKIPFFDVELVGVPALNFVGAQTFTKSRDFEHLMSQESSGKSGNDPKMVIVGGKGGVGKTTTSSALAVSMAVHGGLKVALISTDPAHSLGDAIAMDLSNGQLQDCPLIGTPSTEGSLSVLEVDPSDAMKSFQGVVDQLVGRSSTSGGGGRGAMVDALKDLREVFDTLPAGTDEVVALAKIINLVKKGGYDRIVLDTAPTGHTLRMLSTPGFLADLIERVLIVDERINSNPAVRLFLQAQSVDTTMAEQARSTLLKFQLQMYDLEDLFSNADQTEFLIVTIPTELAVRESMRLLNDLTFESPELPIKVRNIVVNQVLDDNDDNIQTFLSHIGTRQKRSMEDLQGFLDALSSSSSSSSGITLTRIPYLDTEPRGVFGLKAVAYELFKNNPEGETDPVATSTTTSSAASA